ncbi:unnamed protein product [Paramecium pentaurelia]|uniref:Uncharacterized protein n=1 Tax=Paramecium pentaurelia TaxID=43138 RepID=A0A8S1V060_9CILI|nr:unnamed protein product [Paramecium pentaurelia]
MTEAQQLEEFTIYGIQSEFSARGQIKYEDLRMLISDYMQMQPIFFLVVQILEQEHQIQIVEKIKIDIQTIYSTFRSLSFLHEVPRFLNGRLTHLNVRNIKAAIQLYHDGLLTMKDIKDACLIFHLREQELMSEGVPCNATEINNLLWAIGKAISSSVLEEWIKRCTDFLQIKGFIQEFEFLYLMANTVDRWAYYEKIPKTKMDLTRDPKMDNLYVVDQTGYKTAKNPDAKIQHYMNYQYNMDKAVFKGRSLKDRNEYYIQKRTQKHQQFLKNKDAGIGEFKKLLRDPELYVEIKSKLKNAQQILNHSKLNGKMLRVQLLEEFAGSKEFLQSQSGQHNKQLQQEESRKSIPTIKQLKEHPQFQKQTQKIQISEAIEDIRLDVQQHKKMMQDPAFMTEYLQRASSAVSTKASMRKNTSGKLAVQSQTSLRPSTALVMPTYTKVSRPITAISNQEHQKPRLSQTRIPQILDEEIEIFENEQQDKKNQNTVFYGSSNSTKRLYNIDLPWHTPSSLKNQ